MKTRFRTCTAVLAVAAGFTLACPAAAQTLSDRPTSDARAAIGDRFVGATGTRVLWDIRSDLPARLSGADIRIAPALDESNASERFLAYLDREVEFFGVPSDRLELISLQTRDDRIYLKYELTLGGIPVEGLELGAVLEKDGDLIRYSSNVLPDLSITDTSRITREDAERIASAALLMRGMEPSGDPKTVERVFLAELTEDGDIRPETYRLVYRVEQRTVKAEGSLHKLITIDAVTGEVISAVDANPWSITGTVRGEIIPLAPTDPPVIRDLDNLFVLGVRQGFPPGIVATNTDDGDYTLPSWTGNWTMVSELTGPFASVDSASATKVSETASVANGGSHSWTWRTSNGDDLDQINVFYHLNLLHDDLYKAVLNYNWKNAWQGNSHQFRAETGHVFAGGSNAYAGDPMKFDSNHARRADTIYHEASHNVIYSIFGGWVGHNKPTGNTHEAYAFDEGFADFFAAEMLDDPEVNGRDLDNTLEYPSQYTVATGLGPDGHQGGQVIAGVAWDLRGLLRDKFGADFGTRLNTALVFKALHEMAITPGPYWFSNPDKANFLEAMLEADDNDKDITNGTPRDREIFQAFRNHKALPVDLFVRDHNSDQGDVPSNPNGEPWWVSPDIIVQESPLAKIVSIKHDLPKFKEENWIRVRVRNDGYLTSKTAQVHVKVRGLNDPPYVPWFNLGSVTVKNVPPNGDKLSPHIVWKPEPLQILMAEIESVEDITTEPGNVAQENNIARRNLASIVVWAGKELTLPYSYNSLTDLDIAEKLTEAGASVDFEVWHEAEKNVAEIELVSGSDIVEQMKPLRVVATGQSEFGPLVAATGSAVWTEDEILSPLVASEEFERFAGHAHPIVESVPTAYTQRRYIGGTFDQSAADAPQLKVKIADNAKVGDVILVHVAHSAEDTLLGGMTFEIIVAERSRELEERLEAMVRGAERAN